MNVFTYSIYFVLEKDADAQSRPADLKGRSLSQTFPRPVKAEEGGKGSSCPTNLPTLLPTGARSGYNTERNIHNTLLTHGQATPSLVLLHSGIPKRGNVTRAKAEPSHRCSSTVVISHTGTKYCGVSRCSLQFTHRQYRILQGVHDSTGTHRQYRISQGVH